MPGINLTISGNGSSFKVEDACTADSTACTDVWHKMFNTFSNSTKESFELTARFHESEEHLPDLEEEIELEE